MEQIDDGGGNIGRASLSGNLARDKNLTTLLGYKERYSLEGSAWMAQLNCIANTKSAMLEANYDFGKANILKGFKTLARYVVQDFDEAKQSAGALADNKVVHIDLVQQITPQLDARVRFGNVNADNRLDGTDKDSYNEYRFEINYLF